MKTSNYKKIKNIEYVLLFTLLLSYSEYLFNFYNGIQFFEYSKYIISMYFVIYLIFNFEQNMKLMSKNILLIIFLIYALSSVLWTNDYSNLSKVISLLVNFSISLFIVQKFSLINFLRFLRYFFFFILVSSYISVFLFPEIGIDIGVHAGSWNGVFAQKNRTGIVLVYSLLTSSVLILAENKIKKIDVISSTLTIFFVFNTNSSTAILISILIVIVTLSYVLVLKTQSSVRVLTIFIISIAIITTYFYYEKLIYGITQFTGKDLTLTGRTYIWSYLLETNTGIEKLFGNGYGYYWSLHNMNLYEFYNAIGFITTTAHNGFIDIILDLGYVGLVLFLLIMMISILTYSYNIIFKNMSPILLWPLLVLVCMIPYNFSESLFISYNSLTIIFIFASFMYQTKIKVQESL